jgi:phenylpropionate dioxygenase-like ring-hydroxylating dioxygenase large terminal subunit
VALAEELPQGRPPLPMKILGEELALFPQRSGPAGSPGHPLLAPRHRLELRPRRERRARCLYHGWLYDVNGRCLEQPGEPNCGEHRDSIRHLSYPCKEAGGAIFAYMGPGEPPELPNYEFLTVAAERRYVNKIYHECNYLQGNEGNIDPVHLSYLHRFFEVPQLRYTGVRNTEDSHYSLVGRNLAPSIEVELTDFGVRIYTSADAARGKVYLRVSYFVMPNLSAFPGQTGGEGYSVNWHVPIDDEHHWKYTFVFSRDADLDKSMIHRARSEVGPGL